MYERAREGGGSAVAGMTGWEGNSTNKVPNGAGEAGPSLDAVLDADEAVEPLRGAAMRFNLPIIADEIYGRMVFPPAVFTPLASLSTTVPILAVSGLAKEFLVPGWRVGWVALHDRGGRMGAVRKGLFALSQLTLGACSAVLAVLSTVLTPPLGDAAVALAVWHEGVRSTLAAHAGVTVECLAGVHGVSLVPPQGAMYAMLRVDPAQYTDLGSDVEWCAALLREENVMLLPGTAFEAPNFVRIVFCAPVGVLREVFGRVGRFCERHKRVV